MSKSLKIAKRMRQLAEAGMVREPLATFMREAADELERLHEIEHRGSGGQTGATTSGEPVVLWCRPGYEAEVQQ